MYILLLISIFHAVSVINLLFKVISVASYVKVWWLVYVLVVHLSDLYSAGELLMDLDGAEPFSFVLCL